MAPTCAVILAGGRSARMGRDKAFVEVHGETLAARTARVVAEVCDVVVVVGAPGRPLPALPGEVRVAFDDASFTGPLAGIAAGLAVCPAQAAPHALVLGVDLPLLHAELIRALRALAPASRAVALERPGGLVPLPSWIPLARARQHVASDDAGADRSLHRFLRDLDVHVASRAELLAASPALAAVDPDLRGLEDCDDEDTLSALLDASPRR